MKDTEEAAIAILEGTAAVLREILGRLPDEIVTADLDRGWSAKRILAHMVDVEQDAFSQRLHLMVEQDRPALVSIDPLARLDAMGWEGRTTDALLSALERDRRESCAWLRSLGDAQLQRTGEHDTAGEVTASNLLHYWAYHDLAHIRGIQRMMQSMLIHETAGISEKMDV